MARPKRTKAVAARESTDLAPGPEAHDPPVESPPPASKRRKGAYSKIGISQDSKNENESLPTTGRVKTKPENITESKTSNGTTTKLKSKKKLVTVEKTSDDRRGDGATVEGDAKSRKARKTKAQREAEGPPLAVRTTGSSLFIGPHVSIAGGLHNAVQNGVHVGANAFALFLKPQRKWVVPPLDPTNATLFKDGCAKHSYNTAHIVPHGPYLVNLAHIDPIRAEQAYSSYIDDLSRCHATGITLYNLHPGNKAASTRDEAIAQLARQLNRGHADPRSGQVVTLLETMAVTSGNVLGGTFEDLREIIALVKDKARVGICLDTCHVFAAGYDLRTPETLAATLAALDKTVGLQYLRAMHVNDSKAPFGSCRDRHANIGTGFLGLRAFHNIVNEPRLQGLPMVLETPIDVPDANRLGKTLEDKQIWAREIKLLERLEGMDVDGEEFKELEQELRQQGTADREKFQGQVDRRNAKARKKAENAEKKGKKGRKEETDKEASELSEPEDEE